MGRGSHLEVETTEQEFGVLVHEREKRLYSREKQAYEMKGK
jgi:hypothetical protein